MNEKMNTVAGSGMLIFGAIFTLVLTLSDCPAQTNTSLTFQPTNEIFLTFTNRQGRVYAHIKVMKILPDGVLYTVTDGAGGGKIIFADMPEECQRTLAGMSPFEQLKDKASKGDDQIMMQLGVLYATGNGVPTNTKEAELWYTRAANLGNSNAAAALGFMLFDGLGEMDFRESGFLSNYFKASNWFRVAAEAGQPYAQIELARFYRSRWSNTNLTNGEAEAFKWYDKAVKELSERAKRGDKSAQEKLDMWYMDAPESWVASNKPAALRPVVTPSIVQPTKVGEKSDDILSGIKRDAGREWPSNYEMQEFRIKEQVNAFSELQGMTRGAVPADVFDRIKADAANEWPGNYNMQVFKIKNQVRAYLNLQK